MKPKNDEPLNGGAAWRAAKDRIAKRNDEARARGAAQREAHEARQAEQRLALARLERANLPSHP